jgi:hypothetical protein
MRIIIDIDESRAPSPPYRKAVRIRTKYYRNAADCVRVANAGIVIYEELKRGLSFDTFEGDLIFDHQGESR